VQSALDTRSPVVTISIEIELAWGRHFLKNPSYGSIISEDREVETRTLNSLLNLCDEINIPITFNIVGHLLLDACNGKHGENYDPEWLSSDPGTNIGENPLFYASDLIDMICSSRVKHEIATHTFSHILFNQVSEDIASYELQLAKDVHRNVGLPTPVSLVAPQHKQPPLEILQKQDIGTIRSPDRDINRGKLPIQSLNVIQRPHVAQDPELINGVLHSYCTPWPSLTSAMLPNGQRQNEYPLRLIPISLRKRIHKKKLHNALQDVMKEETHLHLWTHLYNMSNDPQWDTIRSFLKSLAKYRDLTDLSINPLKDLRSYYIQD
jgi:hypothetical protein